MDGTKHGFNQRKVFWLHVDLQLIFERSFRKLQERTFKLLKIDRWYFLEFKLQEILKHMHMLPSQ